MHQTILCIIYIKCSRVFKDVDEILTQGWSDHFEKWFIAEFTTKELYELIFFFQLAFTLFISCCYWSNQGFGSFKGPFLSHRFQIFSNTIGKFGGLNGMYELLLTKILLKTFQINWVLDFDLPEKIWSESYKNRP